MAGKKEVAAISPKLHPRVDSFASLRMTVKYALDDKENSFAIALTVKKRLTN